MVTAPPRYALPMAPLNRIAASLGPTAMSVLAIAVQSGAHDSFELTFIHDSKVNFWLITIGLYVSTVAFMSEMGEN